MKIPTVSANGANMPAIGFGTWPLKDDECASMVEKAIRAGYRHIDTAAMYQNEGAVGRGLAAGLKAEGLSRDDVFVTTKVWPDQLSEGAFQASVEASVAKLGLQQVDLVLIHWPPQGRDDIGKWMRLLNDVAERGLTRHIGVSNFTVAMIEEAAAKSSRKLACNQVENHPYVDQRKVYAACERHGMALVAYCPLYRGGNLFGESAVEAAAAAHGKTPAQIVLRWHVQHGGVAIPKTATPSRLPENIAVFDFVLSEAEMADIDGLYGQEPRICEYDFAPEWDAPGEAA